MAARVLALLSVLLVFEGISGRVEPASEASSRRFMDSLVSMNGCGRFAGLVSATANATKTFQHSLDHGGLTFFCPDDKAVAVFEPWLDDLCADGQLAVLLYHGVAAAELRDRRPTKALTVPTLATDLADAGYGLTILYRGNTTELLSSSGDVARVARKVTDEEVPLVIYLIDAMLLPREPIACRDSSFDEGPSQERQDVLAWVVIILIFLVVALAFIAVLWLIGRVMYYVAFVVSARLSPTRVSHCSSEGI